MRERREKEEQVRQLCSSPRTLPGEILLVKRKKLKVYPECLGAEVGIVGSQSEAMHCPLPQALG